MESGSLRVLTNKNCWKTAMGQKMGVEKQKPRPK